MSEPRDSADLDFEAILDAAPDGLVLVCPDGKILRVNRDLTAESATELALVVGFDRGEAIDNLRRAGLP